MEIAQIPEAPTAPVMVQPGWLERDGVRVCLLDADTSWNAWHRAYFDEVGDSASYFLYLAGFRTAAMWMTRERPDDALRLVDRGLRRLEDRGFGRLEILDCDLAVGTATLRCVDSFEAWSFLRLRQRPARPACSHLSGMLAGIWSFALEERLASGVNLACWEVQCVANGDPECRFAVGAVDHLRQQNLHDPLESRHVRWHLLALSRELTSSSQKLSTMERDLAERDRAYKSLIDNMNDILLVLDKDKKVVFFNRAFLDSAGMAPEQALGRSPLEWIDPEDRPQVEAIYNELLAGERPSATYRFRVRRPGGIAYIEASARAILGPRGEPVIETISRDITERERAQRELEEAHHLLLRKQRVADNDLRVAKWVHESLLPKPVRRPEVQIDIKYVPVNRVGGDYCHLDFPDDRYCVLTVCDVSGHGMASALLAARVSSFLHTTCASTPDPLTITRELNAFLRSYFSETGLFVTFFAVTIDLESFAVRYCGAGHPGPILWRARTRRMETLASQNLPVGILDEFLREPPASTTWLEPGDRLLIYTDGVTETMDEERQPLRSSGLEAWFAEAAEVPIFEVGDLLLGRVRQFANNVPHDDMTLILLEALGRR